MHLDGCERIEIQDKIREADIMLQLNHPNILSAQDIYAEGETITIVTDVFQKNLLQYLNENVSDLTENDIRDIFVKIARAVQYMHANRVIHRDIKPENIILNFDSSTNQILELKLSDMGCSTYFLLDTWSKDVGTRGYQAPEILDQKVPLYNQGVDVWALGVVLFNLITGEMPFDDSKFYRSKLKKQVLDRKKQVKFNQKSWKQCDPSLINLVRGMLEKDPKKRLSINQVVAHEWLVGNIHDHIDGGSMHRYGLRDVPHNQESTVKLVRKKLK